MQWENGGYFVMRPEIFDALREGEDMVPHALNRLYREGQLLAQRYDGFWRAVDTFKDRAELEDMYQRGAAPVDAVGSDAAASRRRSGDRDPVPEPAPALQLSPAC